MTEATFDPLDFIACNLHRKDCSERNIIGPLWWCLREEMRRDFRRQAQALVDNWATDEGAKRDSRRRAPSSHEPQEAQHD